MDIGKIKVTEAAAILHVSQQYVRIGLQRGVLPIGTAIKMSSKWTYNISPKLLADYSGADIGEELERIRGMFEWLRKKEKPLRGCNGF